MATKEEPRFRDRTRTRAVAIAKKWLDTHRHNGETPDVPSDLSKEALRNLMRQCLGKQTGRTSAIVLGGIYGQCPDDKREDFLLLLARDFGPNYSALDEAARNYLESRERKIGSSKELEDMSAALTTPRSRILRQFLSLPDSITFLMNLREDVRQLSSNETLPSDDKEALRGLDHDLKNILDIEFDVGKLRLDEVHQDSPEELLEKVRKNSVNNIGSIEEVRALLENSGHIYTFSHPNKPEEPLVVLYVALTKGLADNLQNILSAEKVNKPDTAIFYSIMNAKDGLAGIQYGDEMIKQVVARLQQEEGIHKFSSLSPIPGFMPWLKEKGGVALLSEEEKAQVQAIAGAGNVEGDALLGVLATHWNKDARDAETLRPILERLCKRYLLKEKSGRQGSEHYARDNPEHFHLSNGATVKRLNWLADTSEEGMKQSAGLMVNYYYELGQLKVNSRYYIEHGSIPQEIDPVHEPSRRFDGVRKIPERVRARLAQRGESNTSQQSR